MRQEYTHGDATIGTTYYYDVSARNLVGDGPRSAAVRRSNSKLPTTRMSPTASTAFSSPAEGHRDD